jgi:ribosomal protein L34E
MAEMELRTNAIQKCPQCGSDEWKPAGLPGATGRAVLITFLGIIGNAIASSSLKKRKDDDPFVCKCASCGKKWESIPVKAPEEERLESPCSINVTRPGGFVGAAVGQYTYLNGIRIGILKNGNTLSFKTNVKHNLLYFTDLSGTVYKDFKRFEAEAGKSKNFNFNRKFL